MGDDERRRRLAEHFRELQPDTAKGWNCSGCSEPSATLAADLCPTCLAFVAAALEGKQ